jgi:hypothetical protein
MFDTTLLILGATIIGVAVMLSLVVERLTHILGASPADSSEKSRGFRDVVSKVGAWLQNRSRTDRSNRS